MTPASSPVHSTHRGARRLEIETPEHVAVGYELADLGSRFTALVIDGLILFSVMLALGIGVPLLVAWLGPPPEPLVVAGTALLILLAFAFPYGFFVYFEGLRDGQTPGKRRMRIRAVHDGGFPLTVRGAAIRNLLRLVDMQPGMSWCVGGVAMMLHARTKRLGDMAAGSVVVRERPTGALPEETASIGAGDGRTERFANGGTPRLTDEEFAVLSRYAERREELPSDTRRRIAGRLAVKLDPEAVWDRERESADEFLRALHAT